MLYQIPHYSFLMNSFRFEKLILQVKHTPEDQNYSEVLFITLFLLRFVKSLFLQYVTKFKCDICNY